MNTQRHFLTALLAFCLACPGIAAIHVSHQGDDQNTGSKSTPVRTAERAIELSIEKDDPLMLFADGVYFLDQPLIIQPKHSGTARQPRTFQAISEGQVIFSAGTPLDVKFEPFNNDIFQAKIPIEINLDEGFDGLFITDLQQRLARFPNYDRTARWLKGSSAEAFSPQRITTWENPAGGFLHAMHPSHWGGNHWQITGKKSPTECSLLGGWMNNRGGGVHPEDRFIENIFEELDAPGEWYLDKQARILYWWPENRLTNAMQTVVFSRHEACVELRGNRPSPVHDVVFDGISFRHTARTFMKTKEPLLRSDWRIFRGGAVFLQGCEDININNCEFTHLGGNAVFASGYNRRVNVDGSHFHQIGAGAINFVGDTSAVYNPKYDPYGPPDPWTKINKTKRGPRTEDYPADCMAEDCLIHDIGLVEKQVAGLQISVAARITGRHLSIYDVPRAGINIGENAFGGHILEHCDVFDTVQESSDHGSFNSWGRDRYWHTDYPLVNKQVAEYPELPKIDMVEKNVIRNSRWRCDHGWDIDLDDGSSWYVVENNLCLGGGIKLREGYYRVVRNNLIVANTFHPHVWFEQSDDVFEHNIVATPYQPIRLSGKGKRWDMNLFLTAEGLAKAQAFGVDEHSVTANLEFKNPQQLDFRFAEETAADQIGFQPFDLSQFGVQKANLRRIARRPAPPKTIFQRTTEATKYPLLGAVFKKITTFGEASATGMGEIQGVHVLSTADGGPAVRAGLLSHDVVLKIDGQSVNSPIEMLSLWGRADQQRPIPATIWRRQSKLEVSLPPFPGKVLTAADATIEGSAVFDHDKNYIGRWTNASDTLEWQVRLQPDAQYSLIITQANPSAEASRWQLTGLQTPIDGESFQTDDWEAFESRLVPGKATANAIAEHTLHIKPSKVSRAVMNFRELILVEE